MERRQWLLGAWGVLAGAAAAVAGVPALSAWWRTARGSGAAGAGDAWVDLGAARKIEGEGWLPRIVSLERRDRWKTTRREQTLFVRRTGEDAFEALSAVCTHTGCLVRRTGEVFECPCHHSTFDADGRPLEGPSPRPLDRLETRIERGRLKVRYQRFRPGVAEQEPLGG